jgi:hypothetical protein
MIGFGDFPDPVDLDLARQRVERQRSELSERRFREGGPRTRENYRAGDERRSQERPRFIRIDPKVNANVNTAPHVRAVSDCVILERDISSESRRRGLSSPERAVDLGL